MAIDETGLTKGQVRKLNALRKSVGDDLAEEVFARWLEREAASQARTKPDPVAMKIVEALAGFENDPKFNLGNYGYTLRRAKGKGASGFIAYPPVVSAAMRCYSRRAVSMRPTTSPRPIWGNPRPLSASRKAGKTIALAAACGPLTDFPRLKFFLGARAIAHTGQSQHSMLVTRALRCITNFR